MQSILLRWQVSPSLIIQQTREFPFLCAKFYTRCALYKIIVNKNKLLTNISIYCSNWCNSLIYVQNIVPNIFTITINFSFNSWSLLTFSHQVLFALACFLRYFPPAQSQFVKLGGLQVLVELFRAQETKSLRVRIITLLYDMIAQKVSFNVNLSERFSCVI